MKEAYTAPKMDVERLEAAEDILTASGYGLFGENDWEWMFEWTNNNG